MPCPPPEAWTSLASGEADPDREALLAHAESCEDCRSELEAAAAALGAPLPPIPALLKPRRPLPWAWAAAAALLATVLLAQPWRKTQAPRASPAPPAAAASTERILGLGRSGALLLSGDARISKVREGRVRLESGALLATARGDRMEILCGDGVLSMTEGEAVVEIPPSRPSLLREAGAAETSVRIRVLTGSAEWRQGEDKRMLTAGDSMGEPRAFREGWTFVEGASGRVRDAYRALGPARLPACYVWEARVRRADRRTGITVRLPASGRSWDFPLAEGLMGNPAEWIRVGATVNSGRLKLEIAGQEAGGCPLAALSQHGMVAEGEPGPGLRIWGGDVEVLEARWRTLK